MDRYPSLINVTAKRVRVPGTPSGHTPQSKRPKNESLQEASLTPKKKRWTIYNLSQLKKSVLEAQSMNLLEKHMWDFVSERTGFPGDSCRLQYKRLGVLQENVDPTEHNTCRGKRRLFDNEYTSESDTHDKEVQTDINISNSFQQDDSGLLSNLQHAKDVNEMVNVLWDTNEGREAILTKIDKELQKCTMSLAQIPSKYDVSRNSSILFNKTVHNLSVFKWDVVYEELMARHPVLYRVLLNSCVQPSVTANTPKRTRTIQKLSFIYAILMQHYNMNMSLIQRVICCIMENQHVSQKMYDMLQPLGITLSHSNLLYLINSFRGTYHDKVIENIKKGKHFRLIGDNVDVKVGVKHETISKHEHMDHWFGSLALFDEPLFQHLPTQPQGNLCMTEVNTFLPNDTDMKALLRNFAIHIGRIAMSFMPYFKFLRKILPKNIVGTVSQNLSSKTTVIPLECLPLNETSYADCIDILRFYQNLVTENHAKAQVNIPMGRIQIGGDQKTRERFSGTKRLVAGSITPEERFENLGPITFEFFHFKMKFLDIIYKVLYQNDSDEMGTLEAEKTRLNRKCVDPKVKHHYDADREFFMQFFQAYVLEALCTFFEMTNLDSAPECNIHPNLHKLNEVQLQQWFYETMDLFLQQHNLHKILCGPRDVQISIDKDVYVPIQDGGFQILKSSILQTVEDDFIYNYGKNVLELGLLFTELEDVCKLPDRDRMLSLMKYLLLIFRGQNTMAKYNLEILRLLIHQLVTLSEREANESLYSCFVNTKGKIDSHIPADLLMEHKVKTTKCTIRALGSNKINHDAIRKRTSVDSAFNEIEENFCKTNEIVIRAHKHKKEDPVNEIKMMRTDINRTNPFGIFTPGRKYEKFPNMKHSLLAACDIDALNTWIEKYKIKFAFEIGQ